MPDQPTPSLMEVIRTGLGNQAHVVVDADNPNHATVTFRNGVTADLNTRSTSFSLTVSSHMGTAVAGGKVVEAHNKIGAILGVPNIKLKDITVTGGGDSIVGSNVSAEKLATAHAKQVEHQRAVHTTTQAVLRSAVSETQGMDSRLARAQMLHEVNQTIGVAPAHNPLTGAAPASPVMQAAQQGLSEFQRMLQGEVGRRPAPAAPTTAHPESELTMLLKKGNFVPQEGVAPTAQASAHTAPHPPSKSVAGGNLFTKLLAGGAMAAGAGVAAAAQAPEGERTQAGLKAAGKTVAENIAPGSTETDMCKKIGAATAAVGGTVGAVVGGGGAVLGTAATAAPTLGGSVAASPWVVAGGVVLGGAAGAKTGEILGEGACNLVRNAMRMVSSDNIAMIKHKPDTASAIASNKVPDPVRSAQQPSQSPGRS